MQFTLALVAAALMATTTASPVAGADMVCLTPTYGCGTRLLPKCCMPGGHGMECAAPMYGCGTAMHPKCCEPSDPVPQSSGQLEDQGSDDNVNTSNNTNSCTDNNNIVDTNLVTKN